MEQKKIDRINELAKLAKTRELTAEELAERAALREEYIAAFRGNLEAHLKGITVQYPDGSRKKLEKKAKPLH
ncbi:MAG: DUF896 domain-containing protein [Clostridia bacterium]|nr:DUF896 domain-containing protein [Clostridia bacterium]